MRKWLWLSVFVAAFTGHQLLGQYVVQFRVVAERLADPQTMRATFRAGHQHLAVGVGEQHRALVAALVLVDQLDHRRYAQPDTGGSDEAVLVVMYLVVDEHGQAVLVGHVQIDVDLIGRLEVAQAEIPGIAPGAGLYLLEHAFGLVVGEGAVRHEKRREGVLLAHDFAKVAGHALGILLAGQHPVPQEGVLGHHRGDQHRANQVLLDFRVNRVGRQRQFRIDDAVADGAA